MPGDLTPFGFGFRQSGNIDDRREESQVGMLASSFLNNITNLFPGTLEEMKLSVQNPHLAPDAIKALRSVPPATPLGVEAGVNDVKSANDAWLKQKAIEELARLLGDRIHSFNEPMDPAGPPVALDRKKPPFGLGG